MSSSVDTVDFIVIGAQKGGTTSLFEHLRGHPQVYLAPGKERPFFSHDDVYAAGWPEFASRAFRGAPRGLHWGKVDPWYMAGCPLRSADHGVAVKPEMPERTERIIPERIRALFPDVKLIAILRDPVERCISHYRMWRLKGSEDPRSFDRMIDDLLAPAALESSRRLSTPYFITLGEYGRILEGYYATFPREQIFVCFTRDLEESPRELMRELLDFLGIDRTYVPPSLETRYREGAASPLVGWWPLDLQRSLMRRPRVRAVWRRLPSGLQRRVMLGIREATYRFVLWNRRRPARDRLEASAETLARLRAHYEADRALLEELIAQPVAWRAATPSDEEVGARLTGR